MESIIKGTGALLVADGKEKILVISDLHLSSGEDTYSIIKRLKRLIADTKPTSLVILGDMFNLGGGADEVDKFDLEISKILSVNIVCGNHDVEIFPKMILSNNYCFLHGDKDYSRGENKTLVVGHTHPMFKGKRVFLKGVLKDGRDFILLPVFNELVGGPELSDKSYLLGFIFSQEMIKTADVYDLSGKKIAKWL